MTTINTSYSGSYYSLGNQKTEETDELKKAAPATNLLTAMTESTGVGAYNLDLSPEAKAYLASIEKQNAEKTAMQTSKDYGFKLTPNEKKQLDEILDKYKNAEYTDENFAKMQAELKDARLDSLNLGAKDIVRNFNAASSLMEALGGTATLVKAADRLNGVASKAETYMNQITADWQDLIAANKEA